MSPYMPLSSKGGTIVWAVHESMPDFDIHYEGTYIAAQPIGPLYNGLLTFDVYNNEKIVGDLAERWEISRGRQADHLCVASRA